MPIRIAPAPTSMPATLTFDTEFSSIFGLGPAPDGAGFEEERLDGLVSSMFLSVSPSTLGEGDGDFLTTGLAFGVGVDFGVGVGVGVGVGLGDGDGLGDGEGVGVGAGAFAAFSVGSTSFMKPPVPFGTRDHDLSWVVLSKDIESIVVSDEFLRITPSPSLLRAIPVVSLLKETNAPTESVVSGTE